MIARAVEDTGFFQRYPLSWRNENELILIWRLGIDLESFLANRHPHAARQDVIVVVHYSFPRAAIDHGLIAFNACSFFAFVGSDCDGPKLNPFHSLIRLGTKIFNAQAIELRIFEGLKKFFFKEGTGNTATPESWIVGKMLRHRLVADDVGNHNSSAALEHPVHFREQLLFIFGVDQVQHTVRDNHIDGFVGD